MILGMDAWIFWLVLMIAFLVAEAISFNLTTIWFAAGSLAAIVLDLFGAGITAQIVTMILLSSLLLVFFISVLKPRYGPGNRTISPTNADRFIGVDALVTEAIDPVSGTGLIKSLGQVWSAASEDNIPIPAGTMAIIVEIRGVKAVVRPKNTTNTSIGG